MSEEELTNPEGDELSAARIAALARDKQLAAEAGKWRKQTRAAEAKLAEVEAERAADKARIRELESQATLPAEPEAGTNSGDVADVTATEATFLDLLAEMLDEKKLSSLEAALTSAGVLDLTLAAEILESRGRLSWDRKGNLLLTVDELRAEMPGVNLKPKGVNGSGGRTPREMVVPNAAEEIFRLREIAAGRGDGDVSYASERRRILNAKAKGHM